MSKDTKTLLNPGLAENTKLMEPIAPAEPMAAEAPSPAPDSADAQNLAPLPEGEPLQPLTPKNESKVQRLSKWSGLYRPKEAEPGKSAALTVERYLRVAHLDVRIAGLLQSLHRRSAMTFEEWERETAKLLSRKL